MRGGWKIHKCYLITISAGTGHTVHVASHFYCLLTLTGNVVRVCWETPKPLELFAQIILNYYRRTYAGMRSIPRDFCYNTAPWLTLSPVPHRVRVARGGARRRQQLFASLHFQFHCISCSHISFTRHSLRLVLEHKCCIRCSPCTACGISGALRKD